MHRQARGFTIVELLIVIVVIAVLSSISVMAYNGIQQRARDSDRRNDIATIIKAMENYHTIHGRYPASGGSTSINPAWSTTSDASWQTIADELSSTISTLPRDPGSPSPTPAVGGGNNYDIYVNTGSYCGSAVGQMYILVYRLERSPQENTSIGTCTTNPLNFYAAGSNYRVAR